MQHFSLSTGRHTDTLSRLAQVTLLALGISGAAQAAGEGTPAKVNIREYIVRGNSVLDAETIEQAVYPFLGPQRGMKDIEAARDALQKIYSERGYESVYVDLPEQQVTGGVVLLQVSETRIGRLRVTGAKHRSPLEIRDRVPALQEGEVPDFRLAQTQLGELNNASQQVIPSVKQGMVPGTMDVDLQVEDKSPWGASVGLNNDYSVDNSHLRAMATLSHNNLWQKSHSASLTFFTAPREMDDAKVFSAAYSLPLSSRWSLDLSGYTSDSDVATVGGTNVLGKGYAWGGTATYHWRAQGSWYHTASLGVELKNFDEDVTFGPDKQHVPIRYVPFTLGYSGMRSGETSQSMVDLSLVAASRSFFSLGSDESRFQEKRWLANPSFMLFKGNLSHTQDIWRNWQLNGRLGFQFASGPLVSNEQFSAGGATSVRGYYAAESTGDDGYLAGAELRTPSLSNWTGGPLRDWRFYLFAETAEVKLQEPLPEQRSRYRLSSVGVGTRQQLYDVFFADLDWGYPLEDGPNTEKYDSRLHFNLRASF